MPPFSMHQVAIAEAAPPLDARNRVASSVA
jgi:hypothetical protein